MVQSIPKIRMPINPFEVLDRVSSLFPESIVDKEVVALDYDKKADVLYVSFVAKPFAVDSDSLDQEGLVITGLNENDEVVRITILKASTFL